MSRSFIWFTIGCLWVLYCTINSYFLQ